jgi:hypothetical protein
MYTLSPTASRCSLCYALLSLPLNTTNSTIRYSSLTRRHVRRCSMSSIERLISSSTKFRRLWHQNEYDIAKSLRTCDRCYQSIQQIEQVKTNIEQLNRERDILMNKIEHNLFKRALIVQARRQQSNNVLPALNSYQVHFIDLCSSIDKTLHIDGCLSFCFASESQW